MRDDLLALTSEDLSTLSNRGIVKRAQRELAKGQVTVKIEEDGTGRVTAVASDDTHCTIPATGTLADSQCNCLASRICRHLVRAVFAYQQWASEQATSKPTVPLSPWDPGRVSDQQLAAHFHPNKLASIQRQFQAGQVVELVRSSKPTARIHTLSCTVRFLVPGDIRYTYCDCTEPVPCSHVPLAIWAFRLLPAQRSSGLVETHHEQLPIPEQLLDDIEQKLLDLAELGFAGASPALVRQLQRLAQRAEEAGLIWPGAILEEIAQEYERYSTHDARFSPTHVAQLLGELLIRSRAIRAEAWLERTAVPAIFVRGSREDQATRVGSGQLIGLGCDVNLRRNHVQVAAYLQDMDSGLVLAIDRSFTDPEPGSKRGPQPFWQLAGQAAIQQFSLTEIGASQMLVKGGTRTTQATFKLGRSKASITPQKYDWTRLHAPLWAEEFTEIKARQRVQPPSALRPRRVGENLFVCQVSGVEQLHFDEASQQVQAIVRDQRGATAMLSHPFTSRGAEGTEALLWWLHHHSAQLRFVSGQVRLGQQGLIIRPLALIFDVDGQRQMIQPWVERWQGDRVIGEQEPGADNTIRQDPRHAYPAALIEALGELLLTGFRRVEEQMIRRWTRLADEGRAAGFTRLVKPVQQVADHLAEKRHRLDWDWTGAVEAAWEIAVVARFAQENIDYTS